MAGTGADLGERPGHGLVVLGRFHRDSPLFPARSGALVVRFAGAREVQSKKGSFLRRASGCDVNGLVAD